VTSCDARKGRRADVSEERQVDVSEEVVFKLQFQEMNPSASTVLGSKEYLEHTLRVLYFEVQLLFPIGICNYVRNA
jgi:hypothetical protein